MSKPTRGIVYFLWGSHTKRYDTYVAMAKEGAGVARQFKLPTCLITQHNIDTDLFDMIQIMPQMALTSAGSLFGSKLRMAEMTPFDTTLFLDLDARLIEDPTFGFQQAEKHQLALSIAPDPHVPGVDYIRYNTGVLFFRKTPAVRNVFTLARKYFRQDPICNDEPAFARAVFERGLNPYVLSQNWNYRNIGRPPMYGAIKIWHSGKPMPPNLKEWNQNHAHWSWIDDNNVITKLPAEVEPEFHFVTGEKELSSATQT